MDDDPPLIDDIGIARLLAKLRAIRDHDAAYGLSKTEFVDRAQELAVRQAIRSAQRQRRIQRLEIPLDGMLPHQVPAVPSFVDRLVTAMDIQYAIDRLSRHERQVLLQSFVGKRTLTEIAGSLRLSVGVIRLLRAKAKAKLARSMPRNETKGLTSPQLSQDGIKQQSGKAP